MRQIEKAMCAAVESRFNWHCSNTEVKVQGDNVKVYLHGNQIYEKSGKYAAFTLAGWNSNTTRSRLRSLGVGVRCYDYTPQMEVNGKWVDISSSKWYDVEE